MIIRQHKLAFVSGSMVFVFVAIAILAPWIANDGKAGDFLPLIKFGPESVDIFTSKILGAPDSTHWLGTDHIGRDLLSRLIHAMRNSIFFATLVVLFSATLGVLIGGIMGFFGGYVDLALSRVMELVGNFPLLILQLTLIAFFSQGYGILFFVMTLTGWISYARFTRAEFLRLRDQDFVRAAVAVGNHPLRVFFRHILPNSLTPIFLQIPFDLCATITALGALSFLGFGEPINVASMGELLKQAQQYFRTAWWLAVYPGLTLFILTLSLALFGASLRDIFDPRQKKA